MRREVSQQVGGGGGTVGTHRNAILFYILIC